MQIFSNFLFTATRNTQKNSDLIIDDVLPEQNDVREEKRRHRWLRMQKTRLNRYY